MKKTLAVVLCFSMLLSFVMPLSAFAQTIDYGQTNGVCGESLTWRFESDTGSLIIEGTGDMYHFENKTSPWYHLQKYIYSVNVKEGATSIGNWAFASCYMIRYIKLPQTTLKKIGQAAFYKCGSIEELAIPESVTEFGSAIFAYCSKLLTVSVPVNVKEIKKLSFLDCVSLDKIYYAGSLSEWNAIVKHSTDAPYYEQAQIICNTKVGVEWSYDEASKTLTISGIGRMDNYGSKKTPWFAYSGTTEKIVVKEGVSGIGGYAFGHFFNVKEITLPQSLLFIGANAFYKCYALENITLPSNVTTLSSGAFASCQSLKTVNIPYTINTINTNTFLDCPSLETVTVERTKYQFSKVAIRKNNEDMFDAQIIYADSVDWKFDKETGTLTIFGADYMDDYASGDAPWLEHKNSITKIVIQDGVERIGMYAFYNCTKVESVEIADSVTEIGYNAFYGCSALKEVDLPKNLTLLDSGAFYKNSALERITLPETVTNIGPYTFSGCTSLDTVYFGGTKAQFESITVSDKENTAFTNAKLVLAGQFPPKATVTELGAKDVIYDGKTYTLDSAYSFDAQETFEDVNANSDYKYFHADFVVSFDKDVNDVVLAGYYKLYADHVKSEDWVPLSFENVKAGEKIRLLNEKWYNGEGSISYQELCQIQNFLCGVYDEDGDDFGTTITVELRLYEMTENSPDVKDETGTYITVGKYTYTFPEKKKAWEFDSETSTLYIYENTEDYTQTSAPWSEYASSIKSISIDSAVNYVGAYAFANTSVESFTIPEFMQTVPEGLFANSTLKTLTIPDTVTNIGQNAFTGCTLLETVNYCDSRIAWNKVSVADGNQPLLSATFNFEIYQGEIFQKKFTENFLYRVGNSNNVKLSSLFSEADGLKADSKTVNVTITSLDETANASASFIKNTSDWTQSEIDFNGEGPLLVKISDLSFETELYLEVINAKNVTKASELVNGSCVMLNSFEISEGGTYYLSNATLYGNGFVFDITKGDYTAAGNLSGNYVINLKNAALDNVEIVGKVYTTYGATTSADYNNPAVLATGNSEIRNCYISNCASPVRVIADDVKITNTTLKGGSFANVDIREGVVTLKDVTTINQISQNDVGENGDKIVGFGVVTYYENVPEGTKVIIDGSLTQYNYLAKSDSQYIKNAAASQFVTTLFGTEYAKYIYTDENGEKWINTGILSMMQTVGKDDIVDNRTSSHTYVGQSAVSYGKTGYAYAPTASAPTAAPSYQSLSYGEIKVTPNFDFETKNYVAKQEGSNRFCFYDNGQVNVSFDKDDSFAWDPFIIKNSFKKAGQPLSYTVKMDGVEYTNVITFSESGEYTVEYIWTDPYNYKLDGNGNVVSYNKKYSATVNIVVTEVQPNAKNATFDFNGKGFKAVTIGNDTYIMPNVSATSSTIASKTVNGQTVYYPIVEMIMSDGKTSHSGTGWQAYYPVLSGVVTITDYQDKGLGDAVTYGASYKSMPTGLQINGDPTEIFKYESGSSANSTPAVKNNILVYVSPTISKARNEYNKLVEYIYTDYAGGIYHYFVNYHAPAQSYSSICVAPDTLITLADGTTKEVQYLTGDETLLVWNHKTGKMDASKIAYIVDHGREQSEVEIIRLVFDDGTYLEMMGEHVFYDMQTDKYVAITSDSAEDFIGKKLAAMSQDGKTLKEVTLCKVEREIRVTATYEVITDEHLTCFTNGVLSAGAYLEKVLNIFDIDNETKAYVNIEEDIEKYGLYTYEDFESLPKEAFDFYNVQYFKIAVGKGYITKEDVINLISLFFDLEIEL